MALQVETPTGITLQVSDLRGMIILLSVYVFPLRHLP